MRWRIDPAVRTQAMADMRAGLGVPMQDLLVAALVALPFAGCLGIFVNAATGWPTPLPLLVTLVAEVPLTLWIAGLRQRTSEA